MLLFWLYHKAGAVASTAVLFAFLSGLFFWKGLEAGWKGGGIFSRRQNKRIKKEGFAWDKKTRIN